MERVNFIIFSTHILPRGWPNGNFVSSQGIANRVSAEKFPQSFQWWDKHTVTPRTEEGSLPKLCSVATFSNKIVHQQVCLSLKLSDSLFEYLLGFPGFPSWTLLKWYSTALFWLYFSFKYKFTKSVKISPYSWSPLFIIFYPLILFPTYTLIQAAFAILRGKPDLLNCSCHVNNLD